jgi:histidinol-phosphatase (PHP family)
MIGLDLHVHSTLSADGESSVIDYSRRAQELNLLEVGFCEHADLDPRDRSYGFLELWRYGREISAARNAFPTIRLLQGVEISYQASLEGEIRAWLARQAWDYVIVSVHLVDYADGWALVSEPESAGAYFARHSQREAYTPYFEELLRAVRSGLGDVLGHLDLVKRYGTVHYGPLEPADFEEEIRCVLRAAVEHGVGLEINSSGLRQPPAETYPGLEVLRWYRELGGEVVTLGSDAHHAFDLGRGVDHALVQAQMAGFRAVTTFSARQARWLDL